ncbi:MAG: DUF5666 domain-containing protein [Gammaproteobacteria bacterium]|nr:DUF5666 domain-containing protein [Gammaproteobacteria bacterium]
MNALRLLPLPLLLAALLSGCAGGGETGTGLTPTTEPVVSLGAITGFGSVYVNGVHFQTTGSSVSLNGAGANETELKIGMVVKVRGKIDPDDPLTGVASAVEYDNELKGVVTATTLDLNNVGTITVMGQVVTIDNQTQIEGALSIAINNVVEVSGYADGLGNIHATLVEVKSASYTAGEEIELKGTVSLLSPTAKTFSIGSQTISYGGIGNVTLQDGALVEVKSTSGFSGGVLIANRIEVKSASGREFEGKDGQELELEGIISAVSVSPAPPSFTVNGYTVLVQDTTPYTVGARIEVKGKFDGNGNLVLESAEQHIEADLDINGRVALNSSIPSAITVFGKDFIINNQTIMNDNRDQGGYTPEHYFDIKKLGNDDRVELSAYQQPSGSWIVTRLDRINDSADPLLIHGIITATNDPITPTTLTIKNSFVIDISTVAAQLSGKTVGDEIKVEINVVGNNLVATAIH